MTPRAKRWLVLYPVLGGMILAARLILPREMDGLFFAEACGLGACVIGAMALKRMAAGK